MTLDELIDELENLRGSMLNGHGEHIPVLAVVDGSNRPVLRVDYVKGCSCCSNPYIAIQGSF